MILFKLMIYVKWIVIKIIIISISLWIIYVNRLRWGHVRDSVVEWPSDLNEVKA